MRRFIPLLFLLLPAALFAQSQGMPPAPRSPKTQETALLKGFGLTDAQVAQVFDIQDKTRATFRQDAVQIRLLRAQMDKALLPDSPNMTDVNNYITQIAQTRADMEKAFIGARVQLRQIIGADNFPVYTRFIREGLRGQVMMRMRGAVPGNGPGAMRGPGGMRGPQAFAPGAADDEFAMMGDSPMMDATGLDGWE